MNLDLEWVFNRYFLAVSGPWIGVIAWLLRERRVRQLSVRERIKITRSTIELCKEGELPATYASTIPKMIESCAGFEVYAWTIYGNRFHATYYEYCQLNEADVSPRFDTKNYELPEALCHITYAAPKQRLLDLLDEIYRCAK